ncbi:MAG: peptidase C13 [Caulobacteraceae bacterium]|nr:peptidase C13 [Caulobacteraceae bacterium]
MALTLIAAPAAPGGAWAAPSFHDWAAVVAAGDDHSAHAGELTEAFDNARRAIAAALVRKGFARAHIRQFSVRPERYPEADPVRVGPAAIFAGLRDLAIRAPGGCLIYLTSHGAPQGAIAGEGLLTPRRLAALVDRACPARPTVVVVSACFSGVFVPALAGPDRMVLTAARRDRSSFGCGEGDTYPFFDGCVLETLPRARDFIDLAPKVRACVERRERIEHMRPPSEPQASVGAALRLNLPAFSDGPG